MNYPLDFARAIGPPLLYGRMRERPRDFAVTEELGFEPRGVGEHVYLYVRKTNANTAWVAGRIARLAGVRSRDVGYAGRKDRHAVTEQWFSCHLPGRLEPSWKQLVADGVEVLRSRRHPKKLRTGAHAANRFRLVIRGLASDEPAVAAIEDLNRRLEFIGEHGFPNYFGEQRFGAAGANLHFADELFKGQRFARDRRSLYISAARSYLFNRELSRLVVDDSWRGGDGWLRGTSRRPLPPLEDPPFSDWCDGLEALGVKAMRRPLRVIPGNLHFELNGDSLLLSFELRAGSYATSLVRELIGAPKGNVAMEDTQTTMGETLGQTA